MNQAIENYTPPDFYTDFLTHQLTDGKTPPLVPADRMAFEIDTLRSQMKKNIATDQPIEFLNTVEPAELARLAATAKNQDAVERLVGDQLKLDEIEIIAGFRNPAVLSAQKKVVAALESFNQVIDLDENLKQYTAFTQELNNKTGPLKMKDSIQLKYPFPGLTSLKGRIIQEQVAILTEKMSITQKEIITETRKSFWDLIFIERAARVTSETIDAFNRLKDVADALYKSGKTSFQDIIKINIKTEILKEELITLASRKKNIEAKLKELLNLSPDSKLGHAVVIHADKKIPPLESLYALARKNRQELKATRHQISKVQHMIEMAESMIQSPPTLNFSAFNNDAVNTVGSGADKSSFSETTMAAMKNQTPLKPWYGIENPWLNQTKQTLESIKQSLIQQENATDTMVRTAWFKSDKNDRELILYRDKILSLSKSALDVSTREYESGSIPFSQAIGSYTDWLQVKLTIAQKQSDLGAAIADLEKTIGKSF